MVFFYCFHFIVPRVSPLALLIQTDPNWRAFLYSAHKSAAVYFSSMLEELGDSRFFMLRNQVERTVRLLISLFFCLMYQLAFKKFLFSSCSFICLTLIQTRSVDEAMSQLLHNHKECKWLSPSKGNNVYGSEVVERVHQHQQQQSQQQRVAASAGISYAATPAAAAVLGLGAALLTGASESATTTVSVDMLLVPMDSKTFGDQGRQHLVKRRFLVRVVLCLVVVYNSIHF
jgi:hypothetical protein